MKFYLMQYKWYRKYKGGTIHPEFVKQPKQVEEIEAVEFAEWIFNNTTNIYGSKLRHYYVNGLLHGTYDLVSLYEIFKNQK